MKGCGHSYNSDDLKHPFPSLCGAAFHGNLAKLITLSGSLCTLCHLIPELSPVTLSIFSLRAQGMALCSAGFSSLAVYLDSSSGTDRHGRLSQTHALSSPFLLHSQPSACLRLPVCLEQFSAHRGLRALNYFGHKVTGNQWREVFFFLTEGGRGRKVPPKNLVKNLRVQTQTACSKALPCLKRRQSYLYLRCNYYVFDTQYFHARYW